MKRKEQRATDLLHHNFPAAIWNRSDIEELMHLAEAKGLTSEISDATYTYQTLDEVVAHQGELVSKLKITVTPTGSVHPAAHVEFSQAAIEGYISLWSSRDPSVSGWWYEAKEYLDARIPWYAKIANPILTFQLIPASMIVATVGSSTKNEVVATTGTWLALISLGVFLLSAVRYARTRRLLLKRRHEVPTLWSKYGEKILPYVAGAIFGAIAKGLVDRYLP